jgi:Zn-dependent protease with chaperone function
MPGSASTTLLGALPGFVSTIIITLVIIAAPGMYNHDASLPPLTVMLGLAAVSIVAIVAMRAVAAKVMGDILRDVSALDRQQLATLEIREPTALERTIARMLGEAGLPYRKDARLMRRRYPMAFALGALCFAVLVIVGLARPADPTPWLVVVIGGAALYAIALARRLYRPPIELLRLSATLPISSEARTRAKVAWVVAWAVVFVVVPSVFAALRLL